MMTSCLGARDQAILLHHTGNERSVHDATGNEGKRGAHDCAVRQPKPSKCATLVENHQKWSGRSPISDALTADLSNALGCPTVYDERHLTPT